MFTGTHYEPKTMFEITSIPGTSTDSKSTSTMMDTQPTLTAADDGTATKVASQTLSISMGSDNFTYEKEIKMATSEVVPVAAVKTQAAPAVLHVEEKISIQAEVQAPVPASSQEQKTTEVEAHSHQSQNTASTPDPTPQVEVPAPQPQISASQSPAPQTLHPVSQVLEPFQIFAPQFGSPPAQASTPQGWVSSPEWAFPLQQAPRAQTTGSQVVVSAAQTAIPALARQIPNGQVQVQASRGQAPYSQALVPTGRALIPVRDRTGQWVQVPYERGDWDPAANQGLARPRYQAQRNSQLRNVDVPPAKMTTAPSTRKSGRVRSFLADNLSTKPAEHMASMARSRNAASASKEAAKAASSASKKASKALWRSEKALRSPSPVYAPLMSDLAYLPVPRMTASTTSRSNRRPTGRKSAKLPKETLPARQRKYYDASAHEEEYYYPEIEELRPSQTLTQLVYKPGPAPTSNCTACNGVQGKGEAAFAVPLLVEKADTEIKYATITLRRETHVPTPKSSPPKFILEEKPVSVARSSFVTVTNPLSLPTIAATRMVLNRPSGSFSQASTLKSLTSVTPTYAQMVTLTVYDEVPTQFSHYIAVAVPVETTSTKVLEIPTGISTRVIPVTTKSVPIPILSTRTVSVPVIHNNYIAVPTTRTSTITNIKKPSPTETPKQHIISIAKTSIIHGGPSALSIPPAFFQNPAAPQMPKKMLMPAHMAPPTPPEAPVFAPDCARPPCLNDISTKTSVYFAPPRPTSYRSYTSPYRGVYVDPNPDSTRLYVNVHKRDFPGDSDYVEPSRLKDPFRSQQEKDMRRRMDTSINMDSQVPTAVSRLGQKQSPITTPTQVSTSSEIGGHYFSASTMYNPSIVLIPTRPPISSLKLTIDGGATALPAMTSTRTLAAEGVATSSVGPGGRKLVSTKALEYEVMISELAKPHAEGCDKAKCEKGTCGENCTCDHDKDGRKKEGNVKTEKVKEVKKTIKESGAGRIGCSVGLAVMVAIVAAVL